MHRIVTLLVIPLIGGGSLLAQNIVDTRAVPCAQKTATITQPVTHRDSVLARACKAIPYLRRVVNDSTTRSQSFLSVFLADTLLAHAFLDIDTPDSALVYYRAAISAGRLDNNAYTMVEFLPTILQFEETRLALDTVLSDLKLLAAAEEATADRSNVNTLHQIALVYQRLHQRDSAMTYLIAEAAALRYEYRNRDLWRVQASLGMLLQRDDRLDSAIVFTTAALHSYETAMSRARTDADTAFLDTVQDCRDHTAMLLNLISMYRRRGTPASDIPILSLNNAVASIPATIRSRAGSGVVPLLEADDEQERQAGVMRAWSDLYVQQRAHDSAVATTYIAFALAARERMLRQRPVSWPAKSADVTHASAAPAQPATLGQQCWTSPIDATEMPLSDPDGENPLAALDWRMSGLFYAFSRDTLFIWARGKRSDALYLARIPITRAHLATLVVMTHHSTKARRQLESVLFPTDIMAWLPSDGALLVVPSPELRSVDISALTPPGTSRSLAQRFTVSMNPSLRSAGRQGAPGT